MAPKPVAPMKKNPKLGSRCMLMKKAIGTGRTRHLQVASGGRFKHQIVSNIVNLLKSDFLVGKVRKLTLNQLLLAIKEPVISNELFRWLRDDALPNHSRIRVLANNKFGYKPPLVVNSAQALLKLLKRMHKNHEGGLLQSLIDDSLPNSEREIAKLVADKRIYKVQRLDKTDVLFFSSPDPDLDGVTMDDSFVQLWRRVDVSNKEMDHIKNYLRIQRISIFNDEAFEKEFTQNEDELTSESETEPTTPTPKAKRKRKVNGKVKKTRATVKQPRKSRAKIRDNVHVEHDLQPFDPSLS